MLRNALKACQAVGKLPHSVAAVQMSSFTDSYKFETLAVTSPKPFVLHVEFNRPDKLNMMNVQMWTDMADCFRKAAYDENVRSIIFSGKGRMFCAGLDLAEAAIHLGPKPDLDIARKGFEMYKFIGLAQESVSSIEKCLKPVIVAVHGACIGGAMDVITACDIRLSTEDAYFCVKEIDVGLAADVGTLQRLSKVIGSDSLARELCYTGRKMKSDEARSCGLVSKVVKDQDELLKDATELASVIASKSPVAVQGTKHNLIYSRDHSVPESLEYIKAWNASMLQTEDIMKSAQAFMMKKTPADVTFSKL